MAGSVLELKRWERVAYHTQQRVKVDRDGVPILDAKGRPILEGDPDGPTVFMELKRPKRHEAKSLRKVLVSVFSETDKAQDPDLTLGQKAAIMAQVFDQVSEDELHRLFAGFVRKIEGLTIDGSAITQGSELLDEADDGVLLFVLLNLQQLAQLSSVQAFPSGSRSTSSVETASLPASPASAAPPTGNGAGPGPSTATADQGMPSSSGSLEA